MKNYLIIMLLTSFATKTIENFNPNFASDAMKELEAEIDAQPKIDARDLRAGLLAQFWQEAGNQSIHQSFDGAAIAETEVARIFKGLKKDNVFGVLNYETVVFPGLIKKYRQSLANAVANDDIEKIINLKNNFDEFKRTVLNFKKNKLSDDAPTNISEAVAEYVIKDKLCTMPKYLAEQFLADFEGPRQYLVKKETKKSLAALEADFAKALS
jgi:hypothetical protein